MAQTCGICKHPRRPEIERALMGNVPYRKIEQLFQVNISTLSRHKEHAGELLGAARGLESEEAKVADRLLAQIQALERRIKVGRKRNTPEAADLLLKISREIRALLELRARVQVPRPASRPTPQTMSSRDDGESEITTEEADQIAAKWLARRASASTKVATSEQETDPTT
jgi:hypothetical protein